MAKRENPAFDKLIADIESVVSKRYVEDVGVMSDIYKRTTDGDGEEFAELRWRGKEDVICAYVPWDEYRKQGITEEQQRTIIENVVNGNPPEKWLEGVFDETIPEKHRIAGFKASVEDRKNSPENYQFEETDGSRNSWPDLSAPAKLQYVAADAARCDVPFKVFAEVARDVIGDDVEAALRVVLDGQKELHGIARLFLDDGRTEPTPLIEQVKDVLDYAAALETQETERLHRKNKVLEGISNVLDGKPPERWLEGVKTLHDVLHGKHPKQQEVKTQERGKEM